MRVRGSSSTSSSSTAAGRPSSVDFGTGSSSGSSSLHLFQGGTGGEARKSSNRRALEERFVSRFLALLGEEKSSVLMRFGGRQKFAWSSFLARSPPSSSPASPRSLLSHSILSRTRFLSCATHQVASLERNRNHDDQQAGGSSADGGDEVDDVENSQLH